MEKFSFPNFCNLPNCERFALFLPSSLGFGNIASNRKKLCNFRQFFQQRYVMKVDDCRSKVLMYPTIKTSYYITVDEKIQTRVNS
jgi:hypothetical protein